MPADGKYLGKIKSTRFGFWDDDLYKPLGMTATLRFDGGSETQVFREMPDVATLMEESDIVDMLKLVNLPIEVEVKGNTVIGFRPLTEVL